MASMSNKYPAQKREKNYLHKVGCLGYLGPLHSITMVSMCTRIGMMGMYPLHLEIGGH